MAGMYIVGTESCSISVDEPSVLVTALYIREIIGISGLTAPEVPLLDPSSKIWPAWAPRPSAGLVEPDDPFDGLLNREQTAGEWARWWRHALALGSAAGDDLRPPRFPAFNSTPSLRTVLRLHSERAILWTDSIQTDPRVKRAHAAPRDGLEDLAREAGRAWKSRPFRLRLTVIPVANKRAWQLAPDHILLSRHLIADRENVLDWLRYHILSDSADLTRS